MRIPTLLVLLLLAACDIRPDPAPAGDASPGVEDASPPGDAGPPDLRVELDAGEVLDAPEAPDGGSDAGRETDGGDASTRVDAIVELDAGELPDAGPPAPDAGPPDLGPPSDAGCIADVYEPNDTPETAALVRTGTGWPYPDDRGWPYEMTWHDGDVADWISADLDSSGLGSVGGTSFRVSAVDRDSQAIIEVRVQCAGPMIMIGCTGSNATLVGNVCVARRAFNAFADVWCTSPTTVNPILIQVGSIRTPASAACSHALRVHISAP